MHRREGSRRVAESLGLYKAREGGGSDRALETGDRQRTAVAYGRTSDDGSQRSSPRSQPHAGTRTPELCPHCLISNRVGIAASPPLIRAPRWHRREDLRRRRMAGSEAWDSVSPALAQAASRG